MPTWPLTLPQSFLIDGLNEEGSDNVIRSQMSTGPAKTRRRYTATVRPFSGRMLFTLDQYEDFLDFYEDDIKDGSLEFDMPGIHGGTIEVKFKDKYTAECIGLHWIVNMNLEEQP